MKKSNTFQDFVKPILVLVIICFVSTFAVSMTYGITNPIAEQLAKETADASRTELLPAAEGEFEEYTGDLYVLEDGKVYVSECYEATNGAGIVVTVESSSYGGLLTAMIGIDDTGAITNVSVIAHSDTPGVGTKAQTEEHLEQYAGLTELGSVDIKSDTTVDYVTGASVSSAAVHKAVACALEQYNDMGGAN